MKIPSIETKYIVLPAVIESWKGDTDGILIFVRSIFSPRATWQLTTFGLLGDRYNVYR